MSASGPKFVGSIPGWGDGFSGCGSRRHSCHMIMWHVKDPLNNGLAWVFSAKLNLGKSLKHPTESEQTSKLVTRTAHRVLQGKMASITRDLPSLQMI